MVIKIVKTKRKGQIKALRVDIDKKIFDQLNLFVANLNKNSKKKIYLYNIIEDALKEYLEDKKEEIKE